MERFRKNSSAGAVNHAISALAAVFNVSLGEEFMHGQIVQNFRKAANIAKPTGPALVDTWDVKLIFEFFRKEGNIILISTMSLIKRLIVCLRVDLFARSSDITKLYREQIVLEENGLKLRFLRPKEWRPEGKHAFKQWSEYGYLLVVFQKNHNYVQ